MHARRHAVARRRRRKRTIDALFVHGVAGLVQRREQRVAEVVLIDASGDAYVAFGKRRAERMAGEIEPAALEIIADPLGGKLGEFQLLGLRKIPANAAIIHLGLRADRIEQRHEPALEFAEQFADRRRGHALVGIVDMRIGNVRIRREKAPSIRD